MTLRRRAWLAALPMLAAGCGFELRRAPRLGFATLALSGFEPRSPLARELRERIAASETTRIVDAASQAQLVLEALADARETSVVASTPAGQVRELTLRARLEFRVRTPQGRELIPATEILLSRDLSYSETLALAKEQESEFLFRAMQGDIIDQVLRRLASVRVP